MTMRGTAHPRSTDLDAGPPAVDPRATALAQGIAAGGVGVAYRPVSCLALRLIHGAQAVVRWRDHQPGGATDGLLALAIASGLAPALMSTVLDQVATAIGQAGPPASTTLDLYAPALRRAELPDEVADALRRHQVAPASLSFAVPQAVIASDTRVAGALAELRGLGCPVGIDDVGSGVTSLRQLDRVDADFIRIDRSIVARTLVDPSALTEISALTNATRARGIRTIAKGVESDAQVAWLVDLGCDLAQGPLVGAPRDYLVLPTSHACTSRA